MFTLKTLANMELVSLSAPTIPFNFSVMIIDGPGSNSQFIFWAEGNCVLNESFFAFFPPKKSPQGIEQVPGRREEKKRVGKFSDMFAWGECTNGIKINGRGGMCGCAVEWIKKFLGK